MQNFAPDPWGYGLADPRRSPRSGAMLGDGGAPGLAHGRSAAPLEPTPLSGPRLRGSGESMNDPNKKTVRSFQCRDALWDTFGLLAADLECSVDYLINEAMKQYARQRGARAVSSDPARVDTPVPGPAAAIGAAPSSHAGIGASSGQVGPGLPPPRPPPPLPWAAQGAAGGDPKLGAAPGPYPAPPGVPRHAPPSAAPPPRAPLPLPTPMGAPPPPIDAKAGVRPPLPPYAMAGGPAPAPGPGGQPPFAPHYGAMQPHSGGALGPPRTGAQPPPYQPHPPAPQAPAAQSAPPAYPVAPPPPVAPALAAIYAGTRFAVNKDRFVIGRGKQSVDLTIKDPNISRQHAMIEQQGGQYFLVDMGSTNGLECNGERVVRRAIAEGDVVRICDHEVRFTFRRG
jgi:neural Wiskott-Aldrich syndrome protein